MDGGRRVADPGEKRDQLPHGGFIDVNPALARIATIVHCLDVGGLPARTLLDPLVLGPGTSREQAMESGMPYPCWTFSLRAEGAIVSGGDKVSTLPAHPMAPNEEASRPSSQASSWRPMPQR